MRSRFWRSRGNGIAAVATLAAGLLGAGVYAGSLTVTTTGTFKSGSADIPIGCDSSVEIRTNVAPTPVNGTFPTYTVTLQGVDPACEGETVYLNVTDENGNPVSSAEFNITGEVAASGTTTVAWQPSVPDANDIQSFGVVSQAPTNAVVAFGLGTFGRLGTGNNNSALTPVSVITSGALKGKTVTQVAAGNVSTCALTDEGRVYCWGGNSSGQLGDGTFVDSNVPVAVNTSGVLSGKTVTSISVGALHACAVTSDGLAACWGAGANGRLGNNSTANSNVPVAVVTSGALSGKSVTAVSAGASHTCAIASGAALCWGNGLNGRLGNGSTATTSSPVAVSTSGVLSGVQITSIAAGAYHSCAAGQNGRAYCWGPGTSGALGNGSTTQVTVPVAVSTSGVLSGKSVATVAASNQTSCALSTDGDAFCWGANGSGQLGNGTQTQSLVPARVTTGGALRSGSTTAIAMSPSAGHVCAIADARVVCWGLNTSGQLGDGTQAMRVAPVSVVNSAANADSSSTGIAVGSAHTVVLVER